MDESRRDFPPHGECGVILETGERDNIAARPTSNRGTGTTFNATTHVPQLKSRRIWRYRWPLVITATLVMTAVFPLPRLVNAARPGAVVLATLRKPVAYYVFAPASNVLDALTVLSPAQYWTTFASSAILFLILCARRQSRSRHGVTFRKTVRALAGFTGGAVAVIGIALVAWRPMASLELTDHDLIAVDFHSHTSASHDGRSGFGAERNREWHASSGFNAAYVTDHRTFDGALDGELHNPSKAGERTTLLPGVELRDGDEHPILIGVDPKRMRITSPDWREAAVAADGGPAPPMLLLSMPGDILRIPLDETSGPVRIAGIEVSDGSPRGMAQAARDRDAIVALADKLQLALVSASDNHGWGRTAPAWSVLRIPGWRGMSPAQLDIAIRRTIVDQGPRAIEAIARPTAPPPTTAVQSAVSGMMVGLVMFRTMDPTERIWWVTWSWGLCFISLRQARNSRRNQRNRATKAKRTTLRPRVEAAA